TTLLLAAGLVFAASAPASAVDVKVDGAYTFDYQIGEKVVNEKHKSKVNNNFDGAGQRLRLGLTLAASENLSGYIQFQDDQIWGASPDKQGDMEIRLRQAYIDWIIPQTSVKVRMGRQQLGLPADAIGGWNAIMESTWGGRDAIAISAPVADFMNVTAFWNRVDAGAADEDVSVPNADAFGAVIDLKFDGLTVSPYVMYANIDKGIAADNKDMITAWDMSKDDRVDRPVYDAAQKTKGGNSAKDTATSWSGDKDGYYDKGDANAYWVGFSSTLSYFDPFTLKLSGAYGAKAYGDGLKDNDGKEVKDRHGWYVQAKASYKTVYGTPVLGAWYASGDDRDEYGRQGWIPTLGGRFGATHLYNPKSAAAVSCMPGQRNNVAGTWGIQAGIENVSFLEDLSHTFLVTMYKGTNNSGNDYAKSENAWDYLTYEDTLVEFDLLSTYKIYKNLSATLELGYIIADIDNGAHSAPGATGKDKADYGSSAWRTGLVFAYTF
uniref:outer membrane homotrimeric porin n=1 Tax=uncultured Mailhella sp. TaxID=1981031 RepID=UPI0026148550